MLRLLYKEQPENKAEAVRKGIKFLNCGEDYSSEGTAPEARIFSFTRDAKFIYTAINKSHRVDIQAIDRLHWWKFCYMFSDINEDTMFSRIIDIRSRKKRGKLSKEEHEYYARNKKIIEIQDNQSQETEKAKNEFLSLLNKGKE